ncbi:MAG: hypothetical protein JOY84_11440 [Curvibacter sp.]|nr:hypothetical protein [Curvibacter sp.]
MADFINSVIERVSGEELDQDRAIQRIQEQDSLLELEFLDSAFQQIGDTTLPPAVVEALSVKRSEMLLVMYSQSIGWALTLDKLQALVREGFPGLTMADKYKLKQVVLARSRALAAGPGR